MGGLNLIAVKAEVEAEICVQSHLHEYAVLHNRVNALPAVWSAHRRSEQRDAIEHIAPFKSRRSAMEV